MINGFTDGSIPDYQMSAMTWQSVFGHSKRHCDRPRHEDSGMCLISLESMELRWIAQYLWGWR